MLKSKWILYKLLQKTPNACAIPRRLVHYIQGQVSEKNIREYFYFIDHQGQLFLDDSKMKNFTSCFKEKDFLRFFFKRIKPNTTSKYPEFPYVSPCGPEMNYIRCDDLPIVFTKVLTVDGVEVLSYNNGEDKLTHPLSPSSVCMQPLTGRVYHPGPDRVGGVGLVKSQIAIEWSHSFGYDNSMDDSKPPTHFTWHGQKHKLHNNLFDKINKFSALTKSHGEG